MEICIVKSDIFTSALIDTFMFDGWGWKEEQAFAQNKAAAHPVMQLPQCFFIQYILMYYHWSSGPDVKQFLNVNVDFNWRICRLMCWVISSNSV